MTAVVTREEPRSSEGTEIERVAFLRDLGLLDTEPEQHYDWLTAKAAEVCGTPIALLTVIDDERQWFKSRVGLDLSETPRAWSFCQHTFGMSKALIVPDARLDACFSRIPPVTDLDVRFYAGVGVSVEGRPLGALCVLDVQPRVLSARQITELTALARQAEVALELVHRRREADRNLRVAMDAEERNRTEHRVLVEDAVDAILTSHRGRISYANAAAHSLFSPEGGVLVGRNILELVHPGDRRRANRAVRVTEVERRDIGPVEYRVVTGAGRVVETEVRSTAAIDEGRHATQTIIRDISDRKRAERMRVALEHAVTHDATTGLLNRRSLHDQLVEMLASVPDGQRVGVALLSIDGVGFGIEGMGHDARDDFIRSVASRLRSSVTEDDLLAALSGEQFAVCRAGRASREDMEDLLTKLRAALAAPFVVGDEELFLRIDVGVADSTHCGDAEKLVAGATAALWQAREAGGNRCEWLDGALRHRIARRLELAASLRHAIDNGGLSVHYQPKVRLVDGLVLGAEALVRWTSPVHGEVAPDELISVAESSGLIHVLGRQVLERACRDATGWQWLHPEVRSTVAVNVSAQQLHEPGFPAVVANALASSGLDPSCLCLELTETSVMHDVAAATDVLRELKALGVTLAIDDFGTGYSSLAYLKAFPIDQIKIDRSFVAELDRNPEDRHIVAAVVAVAAALSLDVVAEGVETPAQLEVLVELGCTVAQGHLWAPAAPNEELRGLLGAMVQVLDGAGIPPSQRDHSPYDAEGGADDALALIDHELRNHLALLSGFGDLLVAAEIDGPEGGAVVGRTAQRMTSILDSLNDLRSISRGSLGLDRRPTDLATLISEVLDHVTAADRTAHVALGPVAGPVLVDIDAARIAQVVDNLLRNALRFNDPDEAVSVTIQDGDDVRIIVADRGPGVPEAATGLIFRKFGRAHPAGGSNSGLGLYLARGIARAHGGDVRYSHRAGGGAQFSIHLPKPSTVMDSGDRP